MEPNTLLVSFTPVIATFEWIPGFGRPHLGTGGWKCRKPQTVQPIRTQRLAECPHRPRAPRCWSSTGCLSWAHFLWNIDIYKYREWNEVLSPVPKVFTLSRAIWHHFVWLPYFSKTGKRQLPELSDGQNTIIVLFFSMTCHYTDWHGFCTSTLYSYFILIRKSSSFKMYTKIHTEQNELRTGW